MDPTGGEQRAVEHGVKPEGFTLRHYLQVLRRRKWIILQALLVVTGAAVAYSVTQKKLYQGTAQVLVRRQDLADTLNNRLSPNSDAQLADRLDLTEVDVSRSPVVAARTLAALRLTGRTTQQFLNNTSVAQVPNTDILQMQAIDASPQLATKLATTYAMQFGAYQTQIDTAQIQQARQEIAARIATLGKKSPLVAGLQADDQQLATLQTLTASNVTLVPSSTHAVLVQPLTARNTAVGVVFGLLLGLALAFMRDALDTRVRSADEIAAELGLTLLARVPTPPAGLVKQNELTMLKDPSSPASEPFRLLRTNLDFALISRSSATLLVTSALPSEGKSTTLSNLAVAMARTGRRVIAVDLDLRKPYLHRFFGGRGGVTEVILGRTQLDDALVEIDLREGVAGEPTGATGSLQVLSSGPLPPDPGEFIASSALDQLLAELRRRADIVLVDAPPLLNLGDALTLSGKVDAMLIVSNLKLVRRPILKETRRALFACPAAKLGFVLTGADVEEAYGYGYGYGYGSGYGSAGRRLARAEEPAGEAPAPRYAPSAEPVPVTDPEPEPEATVITVDPSPAPERQPEVLAASAVGNGTSNGHAAATHGELEILEQAPLAPPPPPTGAQRAPQRVRRMRWRRSSARD